MLVVSKHYDPAILEALDLAWSLLTMYSRFMKSCWGCDRGKSLITDKEVFEGERSHLDGFWPGRVHEEFVWTLGPIGQSLPRFRVRRIAPGERRDPWVYVTVGAWEATADGAHVLHPRRRSSLRRRQRRRHGERVLDRFLSGVDVAGEADQGGDAAAVLPAEDSLCGNCARA
jgi:hypothetical protein